MLQKVNTHINSSSSADVKDFAEEFYLKVPISTSDADYCIILEQKEVSNHSISLYEVEVGIIFRHYCIYFMSLYCNT